MEQLTEEKTTQKVDFVFRLELTKRLGGRWEVFAERGVSNFEILPRFELAKISKAIHYWWNQMSRTYRLDLMHKKVKQMEEEQSRKNV